MVCRTWAKICRPAVFYMVEMDNAKKFRRLLDILRSSERNAGLVRVLRIDRWKAQGPADGQQMPSLPLSLATYDGQLRQLVDLAWAGKEHALATSQDTKDTLSLGSTRHAPPRIEAALSALLRPMQGLTKLDIFGMQLKSFTQLLRALRAVPLIKHIRLTSVVVLHAPERVHWPSSTVLASLSELSVANCTMPFHALSPLLALPLHGTPNPDTLSTQDEQHSAALDDGVLHPGHSAVLRRIAAALVHFRRALRDHSPEEQLSCHIQRYRRSGENYGTVLPAIAVLSCFRSTAPVFRP